MTSDAWILVLEYLFHLTLRHGWNLVALPVRPADPRMDELFGDVCSGPAYEWTGGAYQIALRLAAKHGYWLYSGRQLPVEMLILGAAVEDPWTRLTQGWNLIGPVAVPPYAAVALPLAVTPGGRLVSPYIGWNTEVGQYDVATLSLDCGAAYWIYANGDAQLKCRN